MPEQKRKRKKGRRSLRLVLIVAAIGLAGWIGWSQLAPMVTADAITVYTPFTTETADINTTKSFSASLNVKKSETFSAAEESMVRAIYVQSGATVQKGDQLVALSTGDVFTAGFDGVVNEIRVSEGDWLWPSFSVVQVSDLEHLQVSMNVDEYDVKALTVGQQCTVSVISLGIDFETVISHINRVSQSQGNVAYYAVTCDLTVPQNVLPGMQVTVTIPSDSAKGVVTLDMAALAFDESQKPYVLMPAGDGSYTKTYVETGLSDGMKVEITQGLAAGQTVYAAAGTQSAQAAVSLNDVYKAIMGETVVVNDMSTRGGRGGMNMGELPQMGEDGQMPQWDSATGDWPGAGSTSATEDSAASPTGAAEGTETQDTAETTQQSTETQQTTDGSRSSFGSGERPQRNTDSTAAQTNEAADKQEGESSND